MAEIRLERVVKWFGRVRAVDDFSLTVRDGEFMTIVGPSGCGKSTVLNMIAGLEEVSTGGIYFDNLRVNELTPRERDVAMVFQSYALYPHKSVYENLAFPLRISRLPPDEIEDLVVRAARLLGISELLARRPGELSGGQRQRVALGRAIVRRPKLFLLDEPLSNLDAGLRVQMRAELKRLHAELRATFIYVTHDQAEAMTLSDRVAILNNGKLQQCGTTYQLYNSPANTFVATFLGSPAMNLVPARIAAEGDTPCLEMGFIKIPLPGSKLQSQEALAGIRPEHIAVFKEKGGLPARVVVTEPMGDHCIVHVEIDGLSLTGKAGGEFAARTGQEVYLKVAIKKVHIFNRSTGERLP